MAIGVALAVPLKPPSLRSMFPVSEAKPVDPSAEQPAPKNVQALPLQPSAVKGFDAKTSRELTEKRDRFTQTFANADTSETTVISPAPLNFKKANGTWAG
ncbi:hypothetical protein [Kribbella ginsengisoli]|uniref:Uncharacterized protein n=1 Tax=Kribbella ginsengisoli TaxID=363865 RepID=A0ABP6YQK1_9ACTN